MAYPACHSLPTLSITRCPVGPHNSITARDFRHALRKPNQSTTTIPILYPILLRATPLHAQPPLNFPAAKFSEIATPRRDGFGRDSEGQGYSQPQSPVIRKECLGKELISHEVPSDMTHRPRRAPKYIRTYSKKKRLSRLRSVENSLTPPSYLEAIDDGIDEDDAKLIRKKKRRKRGPFNRLALVTSWMGPSSDIDVGVYLILLHDHFVREKTSDLSKN